MSNRDDAWLLDMLLAACKALRFAGGADREAFLTDEVLQNAVRRQLQIIGEAASRVSEAGKAALPSLPWRAIVGMRNRLVHDYVNIDAELVWEVVQNELEPLIRALEEAVPRDPGPA